MAVTRVTRWTAGLALMLLIGVPAAVSAQAAATAAPHGVALEGGVRWQGLDDALASTLRYASEAVAVGAAYRYRRPEWRIGVAGTWSATRASPVGPDDGTLYEEALHITLDHWLARRVWRSGGGHWAAFVGPAAALELGLRRHTYGEHRAQRYDNAFIGLEGTALLEWSPAGGHRLTERVAVPLAGLALRTSYTGLARHSPRVSVDLPPTFVLFRHRLDYRLRISRRLALEVHHEGSVLRHTQPLELAVAWHRVGAALELVWGAP